MGLPYCTISSTALSEMLPLLASTGAIVTLQPRSDGESDSLIATYRCDRASDAVVYVYVLKSGECSSCYTIVFDPHPSSPLNRSANVLLEELMSAVHILEVTM